MLPARPPSSVGSVTDAPDEPRRVIPVVAGLSLGLLLAALDQTVVATALPTIVGELGEPGRVGWLTTAYVLAATAVMPVYGRLGDLWGRRRSYLLALGLFVAASLAAASAGSVTGLVLARFAQGLGGGGLLVLVQAIIADLVPERRRAPYLALVGAVFALASVAGPLVGGALADTVGWRWAFWINGPLGVVAIALVMVLHDERRRPPSHAPLLPLRLLAQRDVLIATGAGMSMAVAMFGTVAYLPTYLQLVVGLSPTRAGLLMTALAAGIAASTLTAAGILRRTGLYKPLPVVGAILASAAVVGLATLPIGGSVVVIGAWLVVLGLGIGCTWDVLLLVVQHGRDAETVGIATAAYSFCREVGVSLGTALVGALFARRLVSRLDADLPPGLADRHLTPARVHQLPPEDRAGVIAAYHDALLPALGWTLPFLVVAGVALCFLSGRPLRSHQESST